MNVLKLIQVLTVHQVLGQLNKHIPSGVTITAQEFSKLMMQHLIQDNPTIILLDSDEGDLEAHVREGLLTDENSGSVMYTFNPWWRFGNRELNLKPKPEPAKWIPFRWTFICLVEEKRTRIRAEKYLEELLVIGHGRTDRFLFVGEVNFLSTFMKSPPVKKFMNIMMLPIDKKIIYQRVFDEQNNSGFSRFKPLYNYEKTFWTTAKTKSLNGQHFRISGTKFPPYLDVVYLNGQKKLMGVNYQIFNQGSDYFNYTFEFNKESSWKLTGRMYKNGTFDGVFGDIVYGRADIASVSTQTVDRLGYADFVGPFGRAHLIYVSSPPETYLGKYAIFRSYTLEVWSIILAFYTIFVFLFHKALQFSLIRGTVKTDDKTTYLRAVITLWSLSFEQTLEKRPKGTRLLMILWVLFAIVIGTGYRSNMAAFISFPLPENKPKTIEELNEATNYLIYFDLSGVSAYTYFEESSNPIIKNLKRRSRPERNTTACVINSFMDRKTVCIGWDFTLKLAATRHMTTSQSDLPLFFSTEPILTAWYTFALVKNSIYTDGFQYIGQTCFETGLTAFWRSRILNQYRKFGLSWSIQHQNISLFEKLTYWKRKSKNETKPLKVENFQFIFLLLVVGIFISFSSYVGETVHKRINLWKKRQFYQQATKLHIIQVEQKSVHIDLIP